MTHFPVVIASDLHLTDHDADAYRWTIFDWIQQLQVEHNARTFLILGDLTDSKDNHPARLVNRIVRELHRLTVSGAQVIVLRGNHDYLVKEHPFFEFLSCIPNVRFINEPTKDGDCVFIPHSREIPLPGLELVDRRTLYCFLHQTVSGAMSSNGQAMAGEMKSVGLPFATTCEYYSGDIHVPQVCGNVTYVGSPYPVHYGDTFTPRVLVLFGDEQVGSFKWEGLKRVSATISSASAISSLGLRAGDQLKVKLTLSRADLPDWQEMRRDVQERCKKLGILLASIEMVRPTTRQQLVGHASPRSDAEPITVFHRYCSNRGVDPLIEDVGEDLLKGAQP